MIKVELTSWEMVQAAIAGVMRNIESHKLGREAGGPQDRMWQRHVEGALGEAAVAKHVNVYWTGKGELYDFDVGNFDVRTADAHHKRLILHPEDDDARNFWFVTGIMGSYQIHGWILGKKGKLGKYWQDPGTGRPAFFVPKEALQDLSEFGS